MAVRMVSRFYVNYADAVQAVADLTAAGISDADISVIESEDDARLPKDVANDAAQPPASTGAKLGAGVGGGIGVLFGVGAISIPLFDPIVHLGWLAPTVIGAVLGVTSRQAHSFAEGLQRGEHLVMVRADESRVVEVETILARTQPGPASEAPLPPQPVQTTEQAREAIIRDEQRIQYTNE
jgi:hypothetical protein